MENQQTHSENNTLDIRSNGLYPSGVLSNLCSNGFRFDGMVCGSMEGFLQSLKRQDLNKQRQICSMKGGNARKMSVTSWQTDQIVWWKGKAIDRQGKEFQDLLHRAYQAMFEQNGRFRAALMQTRGMVLTHSSGENNSYKTILTPTEFCGILTKLRDNYDLRDKTQELIDKSICRKRLLYLYENEEAAASSIEQMLKERLPDIEFLGFNMKIDSEGNWERLRDLCKNQAPDVIIGNGLDKVSIEGMIVSLLRE